MICAHKGKIRELCLSLYSIRLRRAGGGPWVVRLAGAKTLGVTRAEIEGGLRVAFLLAGMPAYVYGKAQLDEVMN